MDFYSLRFSSLDLVGGGAGGHGAAVFLLPSLLLIWLRGFRLLAVVVVFIIRYVPLTSHQHQT